MKTFFNDLFKFCKDCCVFVKKHWFGYIVTNVVIGAIGTAWLLKDNIIEWFKGKLPKKKKHIKLK